MKRNGILNKLELAYAPLSGYEFALVKDDPLIELAVNEADIYIIAQRPVLTFENVYPNSHEYSLNFEIHQRGNTNILKGTLPLIQKNLGCKSNDTIEIAFNFLDKNNIQDKIPFGNLRGFSLTHQIEKQRKFLAWFSPEKLLQNWWKGQLDCEVEGDYRTFLKYKVHYVGKATKQSILKRLTGHNTFQDILSIERPITYQDLPSNEIAVLMFEFEDNLHINVFGLESTTEEMVDALMGKTFPIRETISLDAEKALIKAMQPNYNKELFKNYPKSKDGLYKHDLGFVSYSFVDPITLVYPQGEIVGEQSLEGGDTILVKDNETFELRK